MPTPRRYSTPRGSVPLGALPLAADPAGSRVGVSPPTFRVKAADRARVAYMPGTAWPVTGCPPDSSWNLVFAPVLMPSKTNFDTSAAIRLRSPSQSPPDASHGAFSSSFTTTVFSQRSMRWFDATPRRATPKGHKSFISHATAHLIEAVLPTSQPLLLRAWHTHDAGLVRMQLQTPALVQPHRDGLAHVVLLAATLDEDDRVTVAADVAA
jgi:hypothetical protein